MTEGTQENAMTEIALAMAMGFFSIMVLTMISMGVPLETNPDSKAKIPIFTLIQSKIETSKSTKLQNEDIFLVFDGNSYLDKALRPVDPKTIPNSRRIILGLSPGLSLESALSAQRNLYGKQVVLTTLTPDWKLALNSHKQEQKIVK